MKEEQGEGQPLLEALPAARASRVPSVRWPHRQSPSVGNPHFQLQRRCRLSHQPGRPGLHRSKCSSRSSSRNNNKSSSSSGSSTSSISSISSTSSHGSASTPCFPGRLMLMLLAEATGIKEATAGCLQSGLSRGPHLESPRRVPQQQAL
jgi:hypothetical protein